MGHCILIIEDDSTIRTFLSDVLQSHGYETTTADNGAQGIGRLVERKPCVIVLDYEMPVMDGQDFHEAQQRIAPDIPVICITGAVNPDDIARRVGASSAQSKPVDVDTLCRTVAKFCTQPHAARLSRRSAHVRRAVTACE